MTMSLSLFSFFSSPNSPDAGNGGVRGTEGAAGAAGAEVLACFFSFFVSVVSTHVASNAETKTTSGEISGASILFSHFQKMDFLGVFLLGGLSLLCEDTPCPCLASPCLKLTRKLSFNISSIKNNLCTKKKFISPYMYAYQYQYQGSVFQNEP